MNVNVPIIIDGTATPQFMTQWRLRGPTKLPLPHALLLVNEDMTPTAYFAAFYRQTWGEDLNPDEPICNPDGTPARGFLIRWP